MTDYIKRLDTIIASLEYSLAEAKRMRKEEIQKEQRPFKVRLSQWTPEQRAAHMVKRTIGLRRI